MPLDCRSAIDPWPAVWNNPRWGEWSFAPAFHLPRLPQAPALAEQMGIIVRGRMAAGYLNRLAFPAVHTLPAYS